MAVLDILMLIASVVVIVLISVDAFSPHFDILSSGLYMQCQLPVCCLFLLDFFVCLFYSASRRRYLARNFVFFILSIPYSWLCTRLGIMPHGIWAYVLHLVPTLRAVLALAIVVGFVSGNKIIGLFASYTLIVVLGIYFSSVVFYLHESPVNPAVSSYWSALVWSWLEATTLGASFYPVTTVGKATAMVISLMGILMFPLFTVYLTQVVRNYVDRRKGGSAKN